MMARARSSISPIFVVCAVLVLAIGGAFGAAGLAAHWQAGSMLTVQVPQPGGPAKDGQTRQAQVLAALRGAKGVAAVRALSEGELADLLRPWLGRGGENVSLPLPAVFTVQLATPPADLAALARQLADMAPGTLVEAPGQWRTPVLVAAQRVQLAGLVVAMLVGLVAVFVIALAATGQRSDQAVLLHALGASDPVIMARVRLGGFWHALLAGGAGSFAAACVLVGLHGLLAPLAGAAVWPDPLAAASDLARIGHLGLADWPAALWASVMAVPIIAAIIDRMVARASLQRWLRRLA